MAESRLAVVIPAYREQDSIGVVVAAGSAFADILVIDDCSPDETAVRAHAAGALVISNERNLGYDGTLARGFEEAAARGYTHVVTMDADGEHDPAAVEAFRAALIDKNIPLVLGYRPRTQRFAERIMACYARIRFGARDILCGMKGYDLALWRRNGGFDHGGSIGTELALNALRWKTPFVQLPVGGVPRVDTPRFDRLFRANVRILGAMLRDMRR